MIDGLDLAAEVYPALRGLHLIEEILFELIEIAGGWLGEVVDWLGCKQLLL